MLYDKTMKSLKMFKNRKTIILAISAVVFLCATGYLLHSFYQDKETAEYRQQSLQDELTKSRQTQQIEAMLAYEAQTPCKFRLPVIFNNSVIVTENYAVIKFICNGDDSGPWVAFLKKEAVNFSIIGYGTEGSFEIPQYIYDEDTRNMKARGYYTLLNPGLL